MNPVGVGVLVLGPDRPETALTSMHLGEQTLSVGYPLRYSPLWNANGTRIRQKTLSY